MKMDLSQIFYKLHGIKVTDLKNEEAHLLEEVEERRLNFTNLWKSMKNKESLVFHKSRSRWLKEWDANSKYSHACVKERTGDNNIFALLMGEV